MRPAKSSNATNTTHGDVYRRTHQPDNLSCKPEYHGDGVLTIGHGLLWTPIYKIQMPGIDISKPQNQSYDLKSIPSSEAFYSVTLVIPFPEEIKTADREAWGKCSFKLKKNGQTVLTSNARFSELINCASMEETLCYNGLYEEHFNFVNTNAQDHLELIFECSGFESPKPVAGYILLQSGGE